MKSRSDLTRFHPELLLVEVSKTKNSGFSPEYTNFYIALMINLTSNNVAMILVSDTPGR